MNSPGLLEITALEAFFDVHAGVLKAVNGIDLTITKGETVGLVGESGCGKSTLGRCILRLHRPNAGTIRFKGNDIWEYGRAEKKQYRKEVQMIFQDPYASLDPLNVVGKIVAEGIDIHRLYTGGDRTERVYELLRMVGLSRDHVNRFPHEFSGGQRQRIGIARALAVEPELIVCDEPISALDVSIQAQVVNLLKRLQAEMELSYLFITHDLSMVRQISDRIAVMYLGSIVEIAPSRNLYKSSFHPYTKALLSAIPIPNPGIERRRRRVLLSGDVPSPINLGDGCSFQSRCPYATETCRAARPELVEVESGHRVACHHIDRIDR